MIIDPTAQALHHKSCLGGTLTPEEQEHLRQWHAKMDAEEEAMFAKTREREGPDGLQAKIDEVIVQIMAEGAKIQALERENEKLRTENELLKRQIAQKKVPQTA